MLSASHCHNNISYVQKTIRSLVVHFKHREQLLIYCLLNSQPHVFCFLHQHELMFCINELCQVNMTHDDSCYS